MSLPDGAEYWNDVKKGNPYFNKHSFTHIKGIECGHKHHSESKLFSDVDCYNCKRILEEIGEIVTINNLDLKTRCLNWFFLNGKKPDSLDLRVINTWENIRNPSKNVIKICNIFKNYYNLK